MSTYDGMEDISPGAPNHSEWCGCDSCSPVSYDSYLDLWGLERLRKENETLKPQIEALKKERDELKAWVPKSRTEPTKKLYYVYFKKYDLNLSQRFTSYVREHSKEISIISTAPAGRSAMVEAMPDIIQKMLAGGEFGIERVVEDCMTLWKGE